MARRFESIEEPTIKVIRIVHITCDKCGRALDRDGDEEQFPNELVLVLNEYECVSQKFLKDLCTECLTPIWLDLCQILGVDPDDTSGSSFNNA